MTREDEITIASCAYGSKGSNIDFEAGAKWADNNPKSGLIDLSQAWHDASKEPEEGTQVVAIDHDGWTVSGLFNPRAMVKGVYIYGDLVVDWYSVVRWAYRDDLLPKGGEQ